MTDEQTFERGEDYLSEGRVEMVRQEADAFVAMVHGTKPYRVRLWYVGDHLEGQCSCPAYRPGQICKHCIAAALATIRKQERSGKPIRPPFERSEAAPQDSQSTRAEIKRVIGSRRFIDYHDMPDYADEVEAVAESLATLIAVGRAAEAIEHIEYALRLLERRLHATDDSSGELGDILRRLQELHRNACIAAKPAQKALAKRLFQWAMTADWETFLNAIDTHAEVLGETGVAEYRRLAQEEWMKVPRLSPGEKDVETSDRRFTITHIMENVARLSGDCEEMAAVLLRDLSSPYCFLRVAETYKKGGMNDAALYWAERGMKSFPTKTADSRLADFLAQEYHRLDRHEEAMVLMWDAFTRRLGLEAYQDLKRHADAAGQWPTWRAKALAALRARSTHDSVHECVKIFLWEGDADAAEQEARRGCDRDDLWRQLAELHEKQKHPAKALPIYHDLLARVLQPGGRPDYYREAHELVLIIRDALESLGRGAEFTEHLSRWRTTYRHKRNFIKQLPHPRS